MEWIQALVAGLVLGMLFKKLKLPMPAPAVFAGVLGVVGVLAGSKVVSWVSSFL